MSLFQDIHIGIINNHAVNNRLSYLNIETENLVTEFDHAYLLAIHELPLHLTWAAFQQTGQDENSCHD